MESLRERFVTPRLIIILILIAIVIVFLAQNTASTTVNFLFWDDERSLSVWIFLMALVGFVIGYIGGRWGFRPPRLRKK